jgi:hypothetical protein
MYPPASNLPLVQADDDVTLQIVKEPLVYTQSASDSPAMILQPLEGIGVDRQSFGTGKDKKACLGGSRLHADYFNAAFLEFLSVYDSGKEENRWSGNCVRRRGAMVLRRQVRLLRDCFREAQSTAQDNTDGIALMHSILRCHPYYAKMTTTATLVRDFVLELRRGCARKDHRMLARIVIAIVRRYASQAEH